MNEVLLYGDVNSDSSILFIEAINKADTELIVRVNTNGGDPELGFGLAAKFNEFDGPKKVKVDGKAYSTGFFFVCYADNVEALDVSNFMIHRAAYSEYMESSAWFTDSMKDRLEMINKSLKAAFVNKVDVEKFENLKKVKDKGITVDSIFSLESRVEVFLTAKEAKQIGLIKKINVLTPQIAAQVDSKMLEIVGKLYSPLAQQLDDKLNNKNPKKMTVDELKAEHPAIYAEVVGIGVTQERDRVGAYMAFAETDLKAVRAGIKEGKTMSQTEMAEFAVKQVSAKGLKDLEEESPEAVATIEAAKKQAEEDAKKLTEKKPIDDLSARLDEQLGLKKP